MTRVDIVMSIRAAPISELRLAIPPRFLLHTYEPALRPLQHGADIKYMNAVCAQLSAHTSLAR